MPDRSSTEDQDRELAQAYFAGDASLNTLAMRYGISSSTAFSAVVRVAKRSVAQGEPRPTLSPVDAMHQRRRLFQDPRAAKVLNHLSTQGPSGYNELVAMLESHEHIANTESVRRLLEWMYLLGLVDVTMHIPRRSRPTIWSAVLTPGVGLREEDTSTLLNYLSTGPASPKELSFVTHISRKEIHGLLARLEATGVVRHTEDGKYVRTTAQPQVTVPERAQVASSSRGRPRLSDMLEAPAHTPYWDPFLDEQMDRIAGRTFVLYRATLDPPVTVPLWAIPEARIAHALERMDSPRGPLDVVGDRSSYSLALAKSCCRYVKKRSGVTITPDDLPFVVYYSTEVTPDQAYQGKLGIMTQQRQIMER